MSKRKVGKAGANGVDGSHTNGVTGANGHGTASVLAEEAADQQHIERAKLLDELQVPFDGNLIRWRAKETKNVRGRVHGFCLPYADPRVYKDRLNALLSPTGWSDRYSITTTPTKILVACELTLISLGSHSATGEEWSRNENATTAAEAQAFKRTCASFGLGRYLYVFEGVWVELDHEKRPKFTPELPQWATLDGWRQGLRPPQGMVKFQPTCPQAEIADRENDGVARSYQNVIREILQIEGQIGQKLYRGLLKSVARAWSPTDIKQIPLQHRVLRHMEGAARGLRRAETARQLIGPQMTEHILRSLDLSSLSDISDLTTLQQVVLALEAAASGNTPPFQ